MAHPVPVLDCDGCGRRFVLDPSALVEDEALDEVKALCRRCRGLGSNQDDPENRAGEEWKSQ